MLQLQGSKMCENFAVNPKCRKNNSKSSTFIGLFTPLCKVKGIVCVLWSIASFFNQSACQEKYSVSHVKELTWADIGDKWFF